MSLAAITNTDYVVLLCADMAATRRFYETVLGFRLAHDSPTWVSFRVGTTLLTLRPRGHSLGGDDGAATTGSASVQLAFRVPPSAIDACHTELVAKGVAIVQSPTDLPKWRHRALFFRDPEQNIIEIYAEV
jgi:glyoxylase I family protein